MRELEVVPGIGTKTVSMLNSINIYSAEELIRHYPFRYEILKRSDVQNLSSRDKVVIDGVLEGQPTNIYISDEMKKIIFRINTGKVILNIAVYNKPKLYKELSYGQLVTVIGIYDRSKNTIIANEILFKGLPPSPRIEPIYFLPEFISEKLFNRYVMSAISLDYAQDNFLPDVIINKYNFLDKNRSLNELHSPTDVVLLKRSRQRIKYEEAFIYLMKVNYLNKLINDSAYNIKRNAISEDFSNFINDKFINVTEEGKRIIKEVCDDISNNKRTYRLLENSSFISDAVVAGLYCNFLSDCSAVVTSSDNCTLEKSFMYFSKLFKGYNMNISLVSNSTSDDDRKKILNDYKCHKIDLLFCNSKYISGDMSSNKLGLLVTDLDSRFDVIKTVESIPDILIVSKLSIPFNYGVNLYGDISISYLLDNTYNKVSKTCLEKDINVISEEIQNVINLSKKIYVIFPMLRYRMKDYDDSFKLLDNLCKNFSEEVKILEVFEFLDNEEFVKIVNDFNKSDSCILVSSFDISSMLDTDDVDLVVVFDANLFSLSSLDYIRKVVNSNILLVSKEESTGLKYLERIPDSLSISNYEFNYRYDKCLIDVKESREMDFSLFSLTKDYNIFSRVKEDICANYDEIYGDDKYIKDLFLKLGVKNSIL